MCVHFERMNTCSRTNIQTVKYLGPALDTNATYIHSYTLTFSPLNFCAHIHNDCNMLNRNIHSQEEQHVGISHVVSFWECEANTHTVTRFRRFSPISFIYWSPNGALSNGYSLVACFRGMEFTVRVSESERDWERVRKRAAWGERGWVSGWREGLREVISCSGY